MCLLVPCLALTASCSESDIPSPEPKSITPNACWNPEAPDTAACAIPDKVTVEGDNFYPCIERVVDENAEFAFESAFKINLLYRESDGREKRIPLADIVYHTPQKLEATVPDGISPGEYGVEVVTPFGLSGASDDGIFTINGEPQPVSDVDVDVDGDADADSDGEDLHIDIPVNYSCPAAQTCEETCAGDTCGFICNSDTGCTYECYASQCAAECQGGGRCDMKCNAGTCDMLCDGTGPCFLDCQAEPCTATNNSVDRLSVHCQSNQCEVSCRSGSGGCIVECVNPECVSSGCASGWKACTGYVYVCDTDCP